MWSPTRRSALGALIIAVSLGFGAAPAIAGPGVQLISNIDNEMHPDVTGGEIPANADVRSQTYTLRSSPGSVGRKITLTGMSMRKLLLVGGFDPDRVSFVDIVRLDGSVLKLRRSDFAATPSFPEGPALVTDEGSRSRFFRPVRDAGDVNAADNILSSDTRLDMSVGGGVLLAVQARANPRRTSVGRTVRFRASVDSPPAGASFTYRWQFGDGTSATGARVTHRYTRPGGWQAQVIVEGTGGTGELCPDTCGGHNTANVQIGKARTSPRPDTRSGSAGANPDGAGTDGSGSGSGGSGTGSGGDQGPARDSSPGEDAQRAPHERGEPAPRADAGEPVTGILLANSPTALKSSLPALQRAGGPSSAARAAREGAQGGGALGGSVALTLVLVALGALLERRRGTLRLA